MYLIYQSNFWCHKNINYFLTQPTHTLDYYSSSFVNWYIALAFLRVGILFKPEQTELIHKSPVRKRTIIYAPYPVALLVSTIATAQYFVHYPRIHQKSLFILHSNWHRSALHLRYIKYNFTFKYTTRGK